MSEHLPGPWEYDPEYKQILSGIYLVANMPDGMDTEANARLIAAAPELLEVCKWACNFFDGKIDEHMVNWFDGIYNLKHVIALVEGE